MSITEEERKALIEYRLLKAFQTYDDAKFAIEADRFSTAANRLYYAVFHACSALLISIGLEANRHSGMRAMISLHFIKPGILKKEDSTIIYDVFTMRQQCDYDDFVEISKEKVEGYFAPVKDLLDRIAQILNINSEN